MRLPVEEYLESSYSPDRQYFDGLLVERDVGEKEHGRIQRGLIRYLARYREAEPAEQIFNAAPLICIEILSRKDSLSGVQDVVTTT